MVSTEPEGMGDSRSESELPLPNERTTDYLDPEYYTHFNDTVQDFFNLTYSNDIGPERGFARHKLYCSKISENACFYFKNRLETTVTQTLEECESEMETNGNDNLQPEELMRTQSNYDPLNNFPGSYWTGDEKDTFFNCLARFTIHRAEEFLPFLPSKSLPEIYAYYVLLKNELRQISKAGFISDANNHGRVPIWVHSRSLRYSSLPIAHEVDHEFIEYEENQSMLLCNREQAALTKRVSKKNLFLKSYSDNAEALNASLIENKELLALSKIYRANQLFPIAVGRQSCRLAFDSYVLLEKLVKTRTRELIGNILANKAVVFDQLNKSIEMPYGSRISITTYDVWRSSVDLHLSETSMGYRTRYRDGKYPFLELYWQNLVRSLDVQLEAHQQSLDTSSSKLAAFKSHNFQSPSSDFLLHSPPTLNDTSHDFNKLIDIVARGNPIDHMPSNASLRDEVREEDSEGEESSGSFIIKLEEDSEVASGFDEESEHSGVISGEELKNDAKVLPVQASSQSDVELSGLDILTGSDSDQEHVQSTVTLKRSLEDYEAEDNLVNQEELTLNILDLKRDATYLKHLRKRLKADFAIPSEGTSNVRSLREGKVMENLNEHWDRSFAHY